MTAPEEIVGVGKAKYVVAFIAFALLWSFGYGGKTTSTKLGLAELLATHQDRAASQWMEEQANTASGLNNQGNTAMQAGNLDEAISMYGKAIELRTALLAKSWHADIAHDLAASLNNRGIALRTKKDPAAAIADFDESIRLQTRLVSDTKNPERREDLSRTLKLRSLAHAHLGDFQKALLDLDSVVSLQTELLSLTWKQSLASDLATNHVSRGMLHTTAGRMQQAIQDNEAAIQLRTKLVQDYGQTDLAAPLSRNLQAVAWVLATSPDAPTRDGQKALTYARQALKFSQVETPELLATMAASFAETGDLSAAIHWQERAHSAAPEGNRGPFASILQGYREGKPHREPSRSAPKP